MTTSSYRDRLRLKSDLVLVLDVLVAARQTATYAFVADMVGLQARSSLFHSLIHDLTREDVAGRRPVRTSILVRKRDGLPSQSFFDMAMEIGILESRSTGAEATLHASLLAALGISRDQGVHALTSGGTPDTDDVADPPVHGGRP